MQSVTIPTAQNVPITYTIAGISDRYLATAIDIIIGVLYLLLCFSILNYFNLLDKIDIWVIILLIAPYVLYHLLFEVFFDGQSPGKSFAKTKVVSLTGDKVSFSSYLIRYIFRNIEIALTTGGIATAAILIGGKGQRLGDIAANTVVVSLKQHKNQLINTIFNTVDANHVVSFPQVAQLSDKKLNFITKTHHIAKENYNPSLIENIATILKEQLNITTNLPDGQFINTLINDYNYLNQK